MTEIIMLDGYGPYVWASYGATAAILGWLVWSTLAANARARDALDAIDRHPGRDRR
jgi:heme exporter protein CcmD